MQNLKLIDSEPEGEDNIPVEMNVVIRGEFSTEQSAAMAAHNMLLEVIHAAETHWMKVHSSVTFHGADARGESNG